MSNTVESVEAVESCQNVNNNNYYYLFVLNFVGGETIGKIFKASGAHVHEKLNRNIPERLSTKYFIMQGIKNKIWFHGKPFFLLIIESLY